MPPQHIILSDSFFVSASANPVSYSEKAFKARYSLSAATSTTRSDATKAVPSPDTGAFSGFSWWFSFSVISVWKTFPLSISRVASHLHSNKLSCPGLKLSVNLFQTPIFLTWLLSRGIFPFRSPTCVPKLASSSVTLSFWVGLVPYPLSFNYKLRIEPFLIVFESLGLTETLHAPEPATFSLPGGSILSGIPSPRLTS